MTANPATVQADETLAVAKLKMVGGGFRRVPVLDGEKPVGILSEYDVRNYESCLGSTLVRTAMSGNPVIVSPFDTREHAATLLQKHNIGAVLVVENGKLIGIATARDLWMAEPRPLPSWTPGTRR